MTQMLAFHNDPKIKKKFVARMHKHANLDQIVKGQYWENGKGCHVGCATHASANQNPHKLMEDQTCIPQAINYLSDRIFEGLPNEDAQKFSVSFFPSISVGADLSLVMPSFMVWLLSDPTDGVIRFSTNFPQVEKAILEVAALYQRLLDGGKVSNKEWNASQAAAHAAAARAAAARASAYAAAADAARAAARAAYAAAYAAADAAADAAVYAARAVADADAAAARAAAYAAYKKMAKKILQLLSAAPVPTPGKV